VFTETSDFLWYHLPIALRMIGQTSFTPEKGVLGIEQAYPLLAEMIQSFLILLTGRLSAANGVNVIGALMASICIYVQFGQEFSWRWFFTFLLSVPAIVLHMSIGYNDLFAGFMILIGFAGLCGLALDRRKIWSSCMVIIGLGCAMATKYPAWPSVFILVLFSGYYFFKKFRHERVLIINRSLFFIILLSIATSYYPVRNFIRFGNPTFPLGTQSSASRDIPSYLINASRPVRFIHSVFELNRLYGDQQYRWTYDQGSGVVTNHLRMGGWFYMTMIVLSTMLLYGILVRIIPFSIVIPHLIIIVLIAFTAWSNVLRYFLFIPLNSIFLFCAYSGQYPAKIRNIGQITLALCALFVLVTLRSEIFPLDLRTPAEHAPAAAKKFWTQNLNIPHAQAIKIKVPGAYPIFWSGPTFTEIPVVSDR